MSMIASRKLALCGAAAAAVAATALTVLPMAPSSANAAASASSEWSGAGASSELLLDWVPFGNNHIRFMGNRVGVDILNPTYKFHVYTDQNSRAIFGRANHGTKTTTGVYGYTRSTHGRGVVGVNESSTGVTYGGRFDSHSNSGRGLYARAVAASGATRGVVGQVYSHAAGARGVLGIATAPADAVRAAGDLVASGVKAFEIDHPLDPANKYLRHYATESPEPLNVYSGNVALDEVGSAWVQLPDWFEAINRDYRYQLTSIGGAAPNLHVAQEIQNNWFQIAGGVPGGTASWRIEAVRDDLYVRTYGAKVEFAKPVEARGTFLHPELYNLPADRGLYADLMDMAPEQNDESMGDED